MRADQKQKPFSVTVDAFRHDMTICSPESVNAFAARLHESMQPFKTEQRRRMAQSQIHAKKLIVG